MKLTLEVKRLTDDPAGAGWVPQPGLEELQAFVRMMEEKGLVVKRPYDLPLPDYNGVSLHRGDDEIRSVN